MRGGRIDVIKNRQVATLVYEGSKDMITLFLWPSAGLPLAAGDWPVSGFQACTGNAAGFSFVAVSSLSNRELDKFTDRIREQLK